MSLGLVVFSGGCDGGEAAERWRMMAVLVAAVGWSCGGMFCFMVWVRKLLWEESKLGALWEGDVHTIYIYRSV